MRGSVKISEMTNLYSCYNVEEFFRILVIAESLKEAEEKAEEYRKDTNMEGKFEAETLTDEMYFDCDYVIY